MVIKDDAPELDRLKARLATLEQLLQVHEQSVLVQAQHLDQTMSELRRRAEELQRSEQIVRDSAERLQLAMDAAHLGTWDYDILADCITCSSDVNVLLGLPPNAGPLTYGAFLNAVRDDDRPLLAQSFSDSIARASDYAVEFRTVWQDGSVHWVALRGKVYQGAAGVAVRMIGVAMDMTDRRRAEEALRESEIRYRLLFEDNPNPMWVYDLETLAFLEVNHAAVSHYGYSREEFLAMTIKDIRPVEDIPAVVRTVARVKAGYQEAGMWKHRRKDGTLIDVEILGHTVAFGARPGELILARDVTEQKRAEEALRSSEQQFMSFMDNLPGFAWIKDAAGRYVYANKYFRQMFALYETEWEGKTDHEVFPPETAEQFVNNDRQALESGKEVRTTERFTLADGEHIGLVNKFPMVRRDGGVFVGGIAIDVTDRVQAEEALRTSEARFQVFMNNSPAIAFMKDEHGRHLYVNEPFAEFFGKSVFDCLGTTDVDLFPAAVAEELRRNDQRVLSGEHVVELEEALPDRDGKTHHFLVFKFPFTEASGKKVLAGIAIEITDRKYLEEQLRQAQKMEAIGRLAGGVAHDFNNLLTVISGYSELLQHHLRSNEMLRKQAEQIKLAGDRGSALTRQLLAFSRQQVLRPEILDLNAVVTDLLQMLQRLIGEHIVLTMHLAPEPTLVKTDAGQLEQVLLNLVINARDAMPDGGALTITTATVEVDAAMCQRVGMPAPGRYVRLIVRDTGCGMDEVTKARAFEPFFTTKDQGRGTGLGLSTVYGIVTQSHGTVTVESAPGEGATFTIYLPRSDAQDDALDRTKESLVAGTGSETVLVVEDQHGVRGFVRNLLRLNGYQVLEASDGDEALRLCREHPGDIHLLVTDVVMPRMSGRELAAQLTRQRPSLRVLYMSGYTGSSTLHAELVANRAAFLQKPFSPAALTRKVREVLDASVER